MHSLPFRLSFLFLLLFWTQQACAPSPPLSDAAPQEQLPETTNQTCFSQTTESPVIREFNYIGQAPRQPRTLLFSLKWSDKQSDLSGGHYQFIIDGTPALRYPLPPTEGVSTQTTGTLSLSHRLTKVTYQPNELLRIELKIWDKEGNESNQPLLQLKATK